MDTKFVAKLLMDKATKVNSLNDQIKSTGDANGDALIEIMQLNADIMDFLLFEQKQDVNSLVGAINDIANESVANRVNDEPTKEDRARNTIIELYDRVNSNDMTKE